MENQQSVAARRRDRASIDTPFATEFSVELSGALEEDEAHSQLENIVSLDAEVLASLVIQLRTNLTSAIREREEARGDRDGLIRDLAIMQTRLQELEGAHEREVEMLNEMSSWRKRCEDAEEQVGLLRSKVEESRRAVMTLQTQSRRQSQLGAGYASPMAQNFNIDPSPRTPGFGKRMSIQAGSIQGTTLLGPPPKSAHRRQSSSSEPGPSTGNDAQSTEDTPVLSRHVSESDAARPDEQSTASRRASHRQSAIYIRPTESLLNPMGAELENMRQELAAVRSELSETKHELWEANEAKEASDVCLRALKDFINEHSIGASSPNVPSATESDPITLRGISLPPLPTDNIADEDEEEKWTTRTPIATHAPSSSTSKKGWGLGFWGSTAVAETTSSVTIKSPTIGNDGVSHSSTSPSQSTKSPIVSAGPLSSFVSKWRRTEAPINLPIPPSPQVNSATSSPSPSNIMSAFRWNSPTPQPVMNDNYTPAPTPGSIKRRPSAYSSMTIDTDISSLGGRDSSMTSLRGQGIMETDVLGTSTTESPVEEVRPSNPYVDSTPSLTDAETTAASNSGGSEPASPNSTRPKNLPKEGSADTQELKKRSSNGSLPRTPQGRRVSATASPRNSEFGRTRTPVSPKTKAPELPKTKVPDLPKAKIPDVPKTPTQQTEGKKRARSCAASNAMMGPGMETIEESAGGEKVIV